MENEKDSSERLEMEEIPKSYGAARARTVHIQTKIVRSSQRLSKRKSREPLKRVAERRFFRLKRMRQRTVREETCTAPKQFREEDRELVEVAGTAAVAAVSGGSSKLRVKKTESSEISLSLV